MTLDIDNHTSSEPTVGPYGSAAGSLLAAGWWPLPLPPGKKNSPPAGFTGASGRDPSISDVTNWMTSQPGGNIAVRLPKTVVGIDVDAYDNKPGAATLQRLQATYGDLPPTVLVSSRTDAYSGIRLFQLPTGVDSATFHGGWEGIEIIRFEHRYIVAPPSVHPSTGNAYRAIDQTDGVIHMTLPSIDQLTQLPEQWVHALTKKHTKPATVATGSTSTRVGSLCRAGATMLDTYQTQLGDGSARHDTAARAAFALLRLHDQGHSGVYDAIDRFGRDFMTRIATDRIGGQREAAQEWTNLLQSAQQRVNENPTPESDKGCCGDGFDSGHAVASLLASAVAAQRVTPSVVDLTERDGESVESSTWSSVDLTAILDGNYTPQQPELLTTVSGLALLYRGLVHSFYGESESGKSWVALLACAQVLASDGRATFIDFESDPVTVITRLKALGLSPEQIKRGFTYKRPEIAPRPDDPAWLDLMDTDDDIVIVDGVTEALTVFGTKSVDNDEVAAWMRAFPRAIATKTNAAVVLIDHVTKSKDDRGRFALGAQAKLSGITGAAYAVEPISVVAPGQKGQLALRVTKDRPGSIRAFAGTYRASDRTQHAATIVLDSDGNGLIEASVLDADQAEQLRVERKLERDSFRPTALMEKVSRFLEVNGESSQNVIKQEVDGKNDYIVKALECLVDEGFVSRFKGARGAFIHKTIAVFREVDDLIRNDLAPPRPHLARGEVNVTSPLTRSPFRGRGEVEHSDEKIKNADLDPDLETIEIPPTCATCGEAIDPDIYAVGITIHPSCPDSSGELS